MTRPSWVSHSLYPFTPNYFDSGEGRIHYVDEGAGEPILLVHGTPTWSFLYREIIRAFAGSHRVIAPDNLGFGLSDKPPNGSYRPEDHARRLNGLIEYLGIENVTLGVHDFGGPIGLPYAITHPESVNRLILFNTWLWPLTEDHRIRWAHLLTRGIVGRFLYRRLNASPRLLLPAAWMNKAALTDEVARHYRKPFSSSSERIAPLVLARELVGSTEWYESWWAKRDQLSEKQTLVVWGLKDPAFGEAYLNQWEAVLEQATVVRLADTGHFVPEEATDRVHTELKRFLG